MAVAFGTSVNATPATGTSLTSPSITTPGTNPVVFAHVGLASATATVTSLTITGFGGTATEVKNVRATGVNSAFISVWKIVAPTASTSGTVKANISASVPIQLVVETFSGADQTDPSPLTDAQSSATVTAPQTLTPTNLVSGDASTGAEGNAENQNLVAVTTNGRYLDNTTAINMGVGDSANTTGVTFSDDNTTLVYAKVAVRVKQASATQNPFFQTDWPVPGRTTYSPQGQQSLNLVNQQTNQQTTPGIITGSQCL